MYILEFILKPMSINCHDKKIFMNKGWESKNAPLEKQEQISVHSCEKIPVNS